jgi:hypothetical protein
MGASTIKFRLLSNGFSAYKVNVVAPRSYPACVRKVSCSCSCIFDAHRLRPTNLSPPPLAGQRITSAKFLLRGFRKRLYCVRFVAKLPSNSTSQEVNRRGPLLRSYRIAALACSWSERGKRRKISSHFILEWYRAIVADGQTACSMEASWKRLAQIVEVRCFSIS